MIFNDGITTQAKNCTDGDIDFTNAVSDSQSVIQSAINAVSVNGGVVVLKPDTYNIGSTITIGNGNSTAKATRGNNVQLIAPGGAGSGWYNNIGTSLKWTGVAHGTVLKISGLVFGVRLDGLNFDCNAVADTGVLFAHPAQSHFGINTAKNCVGDGAFKLTTQTTVGAIVGASDNIFDVLHVNMALSGPNANGTVIDALGSLSYDSNANVFHDISIDRPDSLVHNQGLVLGYTDFNVFDNIRTTGGGVSDDGVSYGVYVRNTKAGFPASNQIINLSPNKNGIGYDAGATAKLNIIHMYHTTEGNVQIPSVTGFGGYAQNTHGATTFTNFGIGSSPTTIAQTNNLLLSTTSSTVIVTGSVSDAGLYMIYCYMRVVNASTTVTSDVFGIDEGGVQNSFKVSVVGSNGARTTLNAASLATGSYACEPALVKYVSGSPQPQLKVTAGTANQVYVTATLVKVY